MQKYNSISAFLDDLISLADNLAEGVDQPIQSSTAIECSSVFEDIDFEDWDKILRVLEQSESADDVHKSDEYIYDNLTELGYTSDEISDIVSFYKEMRR